jgi:hypothetical protein
MSSFPVVEDKTLPHFAAQGELVSACSADACKTNVVKRISAVEMIEDLIVTKGSKKGFW